MLTEQAPYEGPERRAQHSNPDEQRADDAENLIDLAREASDKRGVAVRPADLITRGTDDVGALTRQIGIQLKGGGVKVQEKDVAPASTEVAQRVGESRTPEKRKLSLEATEVLLNSLKARFQANEKLHKGVNWTDVEKALRAHPELMWSLSEMEKTGGEPDVFAEDKESFTFGDCSAETPSGRRNIVYDKVAETFASGTFNGNAVDMAAAMGIEILDEEQTHALKKLGKFDRDTWSWVKTPASTRAAGSALCGDRRSASIHYVHEVNPSVHNAAGAFRGALRVPKVA